MSGTWFERFSFILLWRFFIFCRRRGQQSDDARLREPRRQEIKNAIFKMKQKHFILLHRFCFKNILKTILFHKWFKSSHDCVCMFLFHKWFKPSHDCAYVVVVVVWRFNEKNAETDMQQRRKSSLEEKYVSLFWHSLINFFHPQITISCLLWVLFLWISWKLLFM